MPKQPKKAAAPKRQPRAGAPGSSLLAPQEHQIQRLRDEFNRLFDTLFSLSAPMQGFQSLWQNMDPFRDLGPVFGGASEPRADIEESDAAYRISVELPGLEEKDIDLTLNEGFLTLKGEKKSERIENKKDFLLSERRYGSFKRAFRVPDTVDETKVEASFRKGILTIELPKKPATALPKQRKIGIKSN